ncbi:MAG: branched-chain amino acid ABC transporter permease [Anaerolineales bacterium]
MAVLRPAGDFDRSYAQDIALIRRPWQWVLLAVALVGVFSLPRWGNATVITISNQIAYTLIAVQGLSLLTGYTGQISLGQAAFMLVGGYISALLVIHLNLPFLLSFLIAILGTGLVGLIFGLPSLRVKGFYLAMATLAAQFIIPWLARNTYKDYLGGTYGRIEVPVAVIAGIEFRELRDFLYISLAAVLITTILTLNITRSRLGRAFVAIRDNDLAAELLGVNLFSYKLRAFALAAMYAGAAGVLRATSQRSVGPELGYDLSLSIIFLGMLVIGGLGNNLGPFFGVIVVTLLDQIAIRTGGTLAEIVPDAFGPNMLSSFRPIFFGLMLMLFLIFEPRGLAHRWTLFKAAWRLRPFSR